MRRVWCRLFHRKISRPRLGGYYECLVPGCFQRWTVPWANERDRNALAQQVRPVLAAAGRAKSLPSVALQAGCGPNSFDIGQKRAMELTAEARFPMQWAAPNGSPTGCWHWRC